MDERIEQMNPQEPKNSGLSREEGHEFINIFSVIIANAEMMSEAPGVTGQTQRQLERIITACRRGEELVHRIRHPEDSERGKKVELSSAASRQTLPLGQVLVVDDEESVVEIIRLYLLKEGLHVQGITDSSLALAALLADPFQYDLVITDLDMPGLSGIDLNKMLHELRPNLPVIMVTGGDRMVSASPGFDLEFRELLLKPLNRQELLTTVRRLLTP